MGFLEPRDCGTEGYARVFTGTVRSAIEISDTDKLLEITPDEIFRGDATSEVTATVSQACLPESLPEIQVGDKWLFYLKDDEAGFDGKPLPLRMPSFGPSKPVAEAEDEIETLRHLARLTDSVIITGRIERIGETFDRLNPRPVANHKIIAEDEFGVEHTAFTNGDGRYEFVLPPNVYGVSANTDHGLRQMESDLPRDSMSLGPGACVDIDFTMLTDGKLAGRITTADGKPASFVVVTIIPIQPVHPQFTVVADEEGNFKVDGRQPGHYLVGVGIMAPFSSAEWNSRVYYPGVPTREQANVIDLGDGELRADINFRLSKSASRFLRRYTTSHHAFLGARP